MWLGPLTKCRNLPILFWSAHICSLRATGTSTGASNLRNAERCQGVICGKSSERSTNYPLWLFRIPQVKNAAFPRIAAKPPFARIVQQMCNRCIAVSGVQRCLPSVLFVVHLPQNRVAFSQFLNFKVSFTFQVSYYFAGQCDWLQFV